MCKFTNSLLLAAAVVGTLGVAATTASASIIYQDSFTGSASTSLNGAAPTTDNGTSTTWTEGGGASGSYIGISSSGFTSDNGGGNGDGDVAYLGFTPSAGMEYTLSAGLNVTYVNGGWLSIGFLTTPTTSGNVRFDKPGVGAVGWALLYGGSAGGTWFTGPGTSNGAANFSAPSGLNNVSLVLNTAASGWTVTVSDNGTLISSPLDVPDNIMAVGIGNDGTVTDGTFSNFQLTAAPVPEPATLGLVGLGGLGLLLIGRKRKVV